MSSPTAFGGALEGVTTPPAETRVRTSPRWRFAVGALLLWQVFTVVFEMAAPRGYPAPAPAIVATTLTVLGWIVMSVWAGRMRAWGGIGVATVVWVWVLVGLWVAAGASRTEMVVPADIPRISSNDVNILIGATAGPLWGISSHLPIVDGFVAAAVVAAGTLVLCWVAFLAGRLSAPR